MYRILQAIKDGYITNKIINNKFRATDANTGEAGTLDLFKLYDESKLPGSGSGVIEISRLLVKFDLDPLRALTGSILDIGDSSFSCHMKLFDVIGGQTVPSNFNIAIFPLSKSFDEGIGRDVVSFNDIDACNFVTASYANGTTTTWTVDGADQAGLLGSDNLDIISSGNLNDGGGVVDLFRTQAFTNGSDNLYVDVTPIISATMVGAVPDHGFRISYSGTLETNSRTLFVKRFASRHSTNTSIRPRLIVRYDDTISDNNQNFFFDLTGSVFLNNYHRGVPSNIVEGTGATEISGDNCIKFKVESGSFSKVITGSQFKIGSNFITGVYSASFAISSYDASTITGSDTIKSFANKSGSLTFDTTWASFDNTSTNPYLSGALKISANQRSSFSNTPRRLVVSITNAEPTYKTGEKVRFRIFVDDIDYSPITSKLPIIRPSLILDNMYYRILDNNTGDIVIPFDTSSGTGKSATKLSTDSKGMYFDFYMSDLSIGRSYKVEFQINDRGMTKVIDDVGIFFRVDV